MGLMLGVCGLAVTRLDLPRFNWGSAALLLSLSAALTAMEMTARNFKRHHQLMLTQQQEMQRLALVAERTTHAVLILDAQQQVVWLNQAFERMTGYAQIEVIGKTLSGLLHSEQSDPVNAMRRRAALDDGRGIRLETLCHSKGGEPYWLDQDVQPLRNEDGTLTGFIVVQSDITEQVSQRLQLAAVLAALPVGVVVQSESGEIVQSNPTGQAVLGLSQDPVLGITANDPQWRAVHEDLSTFEPSEHPAIRTLRTGRALNGQTMGMVLPSGDLRWLIVNTQPLTDAFGASAGVVSCFVDVTEQHTQQQLLSLTVESAGVGTWQWDIPQSRLSCNERFASMLGYLPSEITQDSNTWVAQVHPQDRPGWLAAVHANWGDEERPYQYELRIQHRDGHWVWVLANGTVVARTPDGKPQRMCGIHLDISESKNMELQLRQRALTDGLTQLPNRLAMLEQIEANIILACSDEQFQFAVLFLDLDRFKQINDTLGHSAGDELLRQVASRLQALLNERMAEPDSRQCKLTAARLGSDEFVVLMESIVSAEQVEQLAQRVIESLCQPFDLGQHVVHSSASVGIVLSTQSQQSAENLLRDAEIAMRAAYQIGLGRHVVFEPAMHLRAARAMEMESDLRTALTTNQLFVVYQPIMSFASDRALGVEALVRWRHPTRGVVYPNDFIPLAEETGLIVPLGRLVLERACAQFSHWQRSLGTWAPQMISVNMSRAQLSEPGMANVVAQVLQTFDVAPGQLQLEVTESLAAQDATVQDSLRALKALGVSLALDDFGTGYSSLSCLHQLPIDTVKIDRSFVSHAQTSEYHRVLIEATIRVAQALGLSTVAEGIETIGEADLIRSLHCDKGQGYLYSRPLEAHDFDRWINASAQPALLC